MTRHWSPYGLRQGRPVGWRDFAVTGALVLATVIAVLAALIIITGVPDPLMNGGR